MVDDNITNLDIGKKAIIDKHDIFTVPSGEKMFKILTKTIPDLILLDIEMPEMDGYEIIKKLKGEKDTADIPVIFLTAMNDVESELKGLSLGAVDFIAKPFSPQLLLKRIELHLLVESQKKELINYNENLMKMIKDKSKTVFELQNAVLKTVAELVECRDDVTGGHIERTQGYLKILMDDLIKRDIYKEEISTWDLDFFILSAQLHDVGKIAIKDSILLKPGKLTFEEFEEMKKHTTFGVNIIKKIEEQTRESAFLKHAEILAGSHHEKWDGTGYPLGTKGEEIPLQGRLMAIVDVYDALTNDRPYKKAFPHDEVVEIIKSESGTHFDPQLVEIFLEHEKDFKNVEIKKNDLDGISIQKTKDILLLQETVSKTISDIVEYRDGGTNDRYGRFQGYSKILINAMLNHKHYKKEVSSWDINSFILSTQLHDVGKLAIKDSILLKADKLTFEEFEQIKNHTTFGLEVVKKIKENTDESSFLKHIEILTSSHHERWDGTGYPLGLKGDDIPLQGRLMAIVDVYDALTHNRSYKKAFSHKEAVEIIRNGSGTQFDPQLVEIFIDNENEFRKWID